MGCYRDLVLCRETSTEELNSLEQTTHTTLQPVSNLERCLGYDEELWL